MKTIPKNFLFLIVGLLSGFFFFSIVHFNISLNKEVQFQIDLINLVSIVINIILAFYITGVLGKQNEEKRVEKNLIIKKIENFEDDLDIFTKSLFDKREGIDLGECNYKIKQFRTRLDNFKKIINRFSATFMSENEQIISNLDNYLRDLSGALTNSTTSDIEIRDNKIKLGPLSIQSIEEIYNKLNIEIFILIHEINNF